YQPAAAAAAALHHHDPASLTPAEGRPRQASTAAGIVLKKKITMANYKLIYFNAYGRAEITRWCFAYGGISYEDERIGKEEWASKKPGIPGGKVPVLMVGEKVLPESLAIARFAAKKAGLVPQDDLHAAACDALVDALSDAGVQVRRKIRFSGKSVEEQHKMFKEDVGPNVITPLLTQLEQRLSSREWLVSDKVTWADLYISQQFGYMRIHFPFILDGFSRVEAHVDKVQALEPIKNWIAKRPNTEL
ncbi:unnamed protein product, partial [Meganyctiphanes norvegica]